MAECPECGLTILNMTATKCPRCHEDFRNGVFASDDTVNIVDDDGELKLVILGDQTIKEIELITSLSTFAEELALDQTSDGIPQAKTKDNYERGIDRLIKWMVYHRREQVIATLRGN